jgi:drug/metabolite transporter (DMT)-like permease
MVLVVFLQFLYSLTFIFGKYILEISTPFFITGVRMLGAGIVSLLIFLMYSKRKQSVLSFSPNDWLHIFILAIFNIYMTNAYEFWGLQYLSAGKAAFIYNVTPFFSAILAYYWFKETMTSRKIIGLIIGCLGFIPILLFEPNAITDYTPSFMGMTLAELSLCCAAMANAIGWVSMGYMIKKGYSSYLLNGTSMILGSMLCFVHGYFIEGAPYIQPGQMNMFIFWTIVMLCIQNIFAYNLNAWLLHTHTATFLAFAGFLMPALAASLGFVFLHELVTIHFIISTLLVMIGLYLFYQEELKQGMYKVKP